MPSTDRLVTNKMVKGFKKAFIHIIKRSKIIEDFHQLLDSDHNFPVNIPSPWTLHANTSNKIKVGL